MGPYEHERRISRWATAPDVCEVRQSLRSGEPSREQHEDPVRREPELLAQRGALGGTGRPEAGHVYPVRETHETPNRDTYGQGLLSDRLGYCLEPRGLTQSVVAGDVTTYSHALDLPQRATGSDSHPH